VLKPSDSKKQVIPWDSNRALELWRRRQPYEGEPLPDLFSENSEVTEASEEIVGRNKLALKAKDNVELMYYTMDDE
jgi:hypothetical protein